MAGDKSSRLWEYSRRLLKFYAIAASLVLIAGGLVAFYEPFARAALFLDFIPFPPTSWVQNPLVHGLESTRLMNLNSTDGVLLSLWHALPSTVAACDDDDNKNQYFTEALKAGPHMILLYFHGNAGNVAVWHRVELLKMLTSHHDCHVIATDYRGFGLSTGFPTGQGVVDDADAVWLWLTQTLGVPASRIVVMGHSLGTGISLRFVNQLAARGEQPSGLILQSPFRSVVDAALEHPVSWPTRLVPYLTHFIAGRMVDEFPSYRNIAGVTCPVMILHGTADMIVPFWHGEALYHVARERVAPAGAVAPPTVELVAVEGGGHNNLVRDKNFMVAIERFLCACGSAAKGCKQ